tara:strand:- start:5244 stop:5534 length:291 start_codon:yes stop_codon:yes gene_type:complete
MTDIASVIGWKHNHQEGMSTKDGVITAFPGGIPSQTLQDTWTAEYDAYVLANSYKDKRLAEYPKIEELVVALYDTDDKAAIEKRRSDVKAKYPKPS